MILMTKELNEILDTNGFSELTVRRSDDGYLNLVGRKCGKPILSFDTMSISKKLTVAERNILRDDYIVPIITTFKKELMILITELKDTSVQDEIDDFNKDLKRMGYTINEYNSYNHEISRSEILSISIQSDTQSYSPSVKYSIKDNKWDTTISVNGKKKLAENLVEIEKYATKIPYFETKLLDYARLLEEKSKRNKRLAKAQADMVEKCSL